MIVAVAIGTLAADTSPWLSLPRPATSGYASGRCRPD